MADKNAAARLIAPPAPKPISAPTTKCAPGKIDSADGPFMRAENEDDDGYDPYSDRRPCPEPLFERDPWD